jgi:soluble lytic murein transglycosylase-like protein
MEAAWIRRLPWDVIEEVAQDQNVPADLLAAVIQVESAGNRFAIRFEPQFKYIFETRKNAAENFITEVTETMLQMSSWGLTQIMGARARELGLKGPLFQMLEPKVNLEYCSKILKSLAKKFTNADDIVAAYNAGSVVKTIDGLYKNQHHVDRFRIIFAELQANKSGGKGK